MRFTVLKARVLRLEYDGGEQFEDHPSQVFWYRQQPVPEYEVRRDEETIEVVTEAVLPDLLRFI